MTGKPLDYGDLARQLNALRDKYAAQGVTLHIIGFAMVVGDMINGIDKVLAFFGVSDRDRGGVSVLVHALRALDLAGGAGLAWWR